MSNRRQAALTHGVGWALLRHPAGADRRSPLTCSPGSPNASRRSFNLVEPIRARQSYRPWGGSSVLLSQEQNTRGAAQEEVPAMIEQGSTLASARSAS